MEEEKQSTSTQASRSRPPPTLPFGMKCKCSGTSGSSASSEKEVKIRSGDAQSCYEERRSLRKKETVKVKENIKKIEEIEAKKSEGVRKKEEMRVHHDTQASVSEVTVKRKTYLQGCGPEAGQKPSCTASSSLESGTNCPLSRSSAGSQTLLAGGKPQLDLRKLE